MSRRNRTKVFVYWSTRWDFFLYIHHVRNFTGNRDFENTRIGAAGRCAMAQKIAGMLRTLSHAHPLSSLRRVPARRQPPGSILPSKRGAADTDCKIRRVRMNNTVAMRRQQLRCTLLNQLQHLLCAEIEMFGEKAKRSRREVISMGKQHKSRSLKKAEGKQGSHVLQINHVRSTTNT